MVYGPVRLLNVAHLTEHKLVLSGTPMPQSRRLVAQFQFLFPEVQADGDTVSGLVKPVYVRTTKNELGIPKLERYQIQVPLTSEQRYVYDLLRSELAVRLISSKYVGARSIAKWTIRDATVAVRV